MKEAQDIQDNGMKKRQWNNPVSRKRVGKSMHSILDGSFLTRKKFIKAIPFIIFLMFLGILYITNIFQVEKTKRQLDDLEEELRELRYEFISSRSKLMFESKPSAVSEKLSETGIRESLTPPVKVKSDTESKDTDHGGY